MQAYLKLDHIDKTFTRGNATTEVLKEINLTIDKGEYVSIIGHSGCGKSTLLNIVAGLTDCTTGCVLLETARSIRRGLTVRWCSRTIACCRG
jgi:nitrate/nitrite transport system ATP-binding protein